MKAIVLKPIVWNTLKYQRPSGNVGSGGFPSKHGYGHEEWNNNPQLIWGEYKLFHTEPPKRLLEFAENGELGMLMISSNGPQYAVGIAVDVYSNEKKLRKLIVKDLGIYENWRDLWKLQIVKDLKSNDKNRFLEHWDENYEWISWRCLPKYFYWFNEPILLDPIEISGKQRLVSEYNTYQRISPEQVIAIVKDHLPEDSSIIRWLEDGDFDPELLPDDYQPPPVPPRRGKRRGGNRPTDKTYSYRIVGKVLVEPKHSQLQERYVDYLREQGFEPKENVNYVDVIYEREGQEVFVEIKPTDNLQSKYAIRFAVGQLLEYRFKHNLNALLEIVLSVRPSDPLEVDFVRHLGLKLTYFDSNLDTFVSV